MRYSFVLYAMQNPQLLDNMRRNPELCMKKHFLLILTLVSCAAAATNDLSPSPQTKKLPPPSSNPATNNAWVFRFSPDGKAIIRATNSISAVPPKLVSKMPVITPKQECDTAMIKIPDSSNDYKLIVKRPDIEVAK